MKNMDGNIGNKKGVLGMKRIVRYSFILFAILAAIIMGNKVTRASQNIVLQVDKVGNDALTISSDTVIDLRGHDAEIYVQGGNVEIKDTLGEGRLTTNWEYGLTVDEGAAVVLENVEIDGAQIHGNVTMANCTSNSRMDFMDGSVAVIKDGNFNKVFTYVGSSTTIYSGHIGLIESEGKVDMYGGNLYRAKVNANTFTIEGGKITNGAVEIGKRGTFKMNGGNLNNTNVYPGGVFIMNKGDITNDKSPAIWLQYESNNVIINGGTINTKNASVFAFPFDRYFRQGRTSNVTINNGIFTGDYIIAEYDEEFLKYKKLDYFTQENIFNININGGKFSVDKNEILIKNKMNVKILGGEFDVPVKVDGCNVDFSNAKFNKGLEIDNGFEASNDVIAVNLKNCAIKDELRIEGNNSKYINTTMDGGIYQEVTIQNRVNKGQTLIKNGTFSKDVYIGTMATATINNGKFSGAIDMKADSTKISNGTFSEAVINSQSVIINGGVFYNKKKTPLHISVKSIKNLKFNGGNFKTGKKNEESVYISYIDKKKAKVKEKTVKSIIKKNYCFGSGYVYTDDAQGTSTSKHIEVYGNAVVKKGKMNWAVKCYSIKLEKTLYSKGKKVPFYYVASVKSVKKGQKYGKLPKVKCKGYAFKGWYTKANGGKKVSSKTKYKSNNSGVLWARMKKK